VFLLLPELQLPLETEGCCL